MPPPAAAHRELPATRVIRSVPPTFSRVTARQPLGSIASAGTKYWPPALLTSTSSRPWRSRHSRDDPLGVLVAPDVAGHRARARADPLAGVREHVLAAPAITTCAPQARELGRGGAAEVGAAAGDEDHASVKQIRDLKT